MRLLRCAEPETEDGAGRSTQKRKIALVGTGQSWPLAPFAFLDEWDIYTMNFYYDRMPRITALFELHSDKSLAKDSSLAPGGPMPDGILGHKRRLEAIAVQGIRVYILAPDPLIPHGLVFPRRELTEHFGNEYATSAAAHILRFVLWEGLCEEIGLWGFDLNTREYVEQRPCIEHWLGWARGAGIKVMIPQEMGTSLFYQPCVYGPEEPEDHFKQASPLRAAHAVDRIAYLRAHEQELTVALAETRGKRLEWEELVKALEATERGLSVPWEGRMGMEWKAEK